MKSATISSLFDGDANRFGLFSLQSGELFLDYSKNLVSRKTRELLLRLADEADVAGAIESMFNGAMLIGIRSIRTQAAAWRHTGSTISATSSRSN